MAILLKNDTVNPSSNHTASEFFSITKNTYPELGIISHKGSAISGPDCENREPIGYDVALHDSRRARRESRETVGGFSGIDKFATRVQSRGLKATTLPMEEVEIPEPKTNRTTVAPENSKNSDSWISNFSRIMEHFLKALMSAGKSNGVAEAARTTVQPAGI
ncbi:hypothetical protein B9Z55_015743 [Caenorhabditis nigoni]|uniref:Uncharacterized protein n=1 Tax=Caenorhabditis nigoni TaxID=1611254 RepID=A0A2G5UC64_9PELO|nr:hypothetical protein B9Z55_015743 [Caenorhabditis nigoni]